MVLDTCNIPERTNKDRVLDYNGLRLIDLCHTTGMLIANGRLLNNKYTGKFTFCSHIGQSTVDYLLMNFTDFNTLSYFDILDSMNIQTMHQYRFICYSNQKLQNITKK